MTIDIAKLRGLCEKLTPPDHIDVPDEVCPICDESRKAIRILQRWSLVAIPQLLDALEALEKRVAVVEASLAFANELLSLHNMAVCDKHAYSWKLDYSETCPACSGYVILEALRISVKWEIDPSIMQEISQFTAKAGALLAMEKKPTSDAHPYDLTGGEIVKANEQKPPYVMVRGAKDDFEALLTAQGMENAGATVFAITPDGTHTLYGGLQPTTRYKVWAKVSDESECDKVDEAISREVYGDES